LLSRVAGAIVVRRRVGTRISATLLLINQRIARGICRSRIEYRLLAAVEYLIWSMLTWPHFSDDLRVLASYVVTGGAVSSLIYILLNTLTPLTYGVTPNVDRLIDSNNISYLGLGMLTGFVFWWIGIFRNAAFPFVSRRFPVSALIVLPLALGCAYLNHSLRETYVQGRVKSIDVLPTKSYRHGQATIQLTAGNAIHADLSNTWPSSMIQGRCVHVENRRSTLRFRRVYEVVGPFGGGVDDC
jgi:hypothetical protein